MNDYAKVLYDYFNEYTANFEVVNLWYSFIDLSPEDEGDTCLC